MSFRLPSGTTDQELTDAIGQLAGVMACTHRQLLGMVVEYQDRCAYTPDGARNMAEWLSARLGIGYGTAQVWVRVARRLRHMPALAQAYEEGRLSFEQLRIVVLRIANEGTDEDWAERAPGHSVAELEAIAQRHREPRDDELAAAAKRRVWWRHTPDKTRILGGFDLPALAGETITKKIQQVAEAIPGDPQTGEREPFETRCADALEMICSSEGTKQAQRPTVVIHGDASFAAGGRGYAEIQEGANVGRSAFERMLCDCDLEPIVVQPDGSLGIGRKSRSTPRPIERRVRRRDRGCRFPGCGLARWTQIHHMRHWTADQGPTNEGNLITVCVYHHHFLHEKGWKARGDPDGVLEWVTPLGSVLKQGPPPLRPGLLAA